MKIGRDYGPTVEIVAGLKPADQVILGPVGLAGQRDPGANCQRAGRELRP